MFKKTRKDGTELLISVIMVRKKTSATFHVYNLVSNRPEECADGINLNQGEPKILKTKSKKIKILYVKFFGVRNLEKTKSQKS